MHDGIILEGRGIPTAVICTEKFLVTARAMAEALNLPDYPLIVIRHPVSNMSDEELEEQARLAAPRVIEIITGGKDG